MEKRLRIIVADDERPARAFLIKLLSSFADIDLVGEASDGEASIKLIEAEQPDLALLDLQMPDLDGFGVVRALKKSSMPLVAFVTAYDEYAVRAFELNAIDYLLKPVQRGRLAETLRRVWESLEHEDWREEEANNLAQTLADYDNTIKQPYLDRIPVKSRDEINIVAVPQISSIVADGELLHIDTLQGQRYTLNFRLKDIELRLDPNQFVRLGRGSLVNIDMIAKISQLPNSAYLVTLTNDQQIRVSRLQSRSLRERLLRL